MRLYRRRGLSAIVGALTKLQTLAEVDLSESAWDETTLESLARYLEDARCPLQVRLVNVNYYFSVETGRTHHV